uniref:Extensin n=1 Tax=Nicotiana sylvestris TaxID=4096 RepID=A0A1U7VR08_NICSY|nr:PREDICTED: extensin [Nicotiana sylvestris]
MGRIGANTIHQFQVQTQNDQHQLQPHQEYTSQVVESFDHQQAETIEEMPPPSTELFHEDLYPEESQNEPSTFASQELTMQQDSVQQQQSVLQAPPSSSKQPTSRPVTTRFSQQNGKTQRPRKQPQPQSATLRSQLQPSQHNSFPVHDPQPQAEAFPPPQSQPLPHAFPPAQDYYEPHVFPPTQEEAQAFPPTPVHAFPQPHAQSVPQAFPPAQDCYEPHEFLPNQEEKEDFPPTPIKAHAFSPPQFDPQFFPPQAEPQSFVPQNHNVQAGTNFPQPNGQFFHAANGLVQGPQGMPLVSPMPQTFMTGIPTKPLLPTESWKTGLFGCMEDPTNALITACFPCLTFGQIAEIVDSGQTTCTTSGLIYGAIFFVLMPCIMSCTYRTKLRSQYGLIESPAPDWVIHCFCE